MEGFHQSVVVQSVTGTVTDGEGRTTATTSSVPVSDVVVAMVTFGELEIGRARGQAYDAVVGVPNEIWDDDLWRTGVQVVISGRGEPLDGTYTAVAIRQTVLHRRVLLSRVESRG